MSIDPNDPRLIAAAPDLYEAAKAWSVFGHCFWRHQADYNNCECDWHLCVRAVAALEAK